MKIDLVVYTHRHGQDYFVCDSRATALQQVKRTVLEWLSEVTDQEKQDEIKRLLDADKIREAATLFGDTLDESFDIETYAVLEGERLRKVVREDYGPECVITIRNGYELRCPSEGDCDYVRIVKDEEEYAYWDSLEFHEDPKITLGALMGALRMAEMGEEVPRLDPEQ